VTGAKYSQSGAKKILRDIRKQLLPNEPHDQQKRGFGLPFNVWLRGCLRDTFHESLASLTKRSELFNPTGVRHIQKQYENGRIAWAQPWLLMMTELWIQEVLQEKP
jgi:asparagine synthase (glutamine-hydrolysing)